MTTLYAYWDKAEDKLASPATIARSRKEAGEKLISILGEAVAISRVNSGDLFITEIEVKRVER
jgi:hypothetical protein